MPPLGAKERAQLPDSAFAYIDSHGRRRLPINDAAHVRNALARFSQVAFEDDGARDRARNRLLRAAKKHGIVPIGFVSAQLEPQRRLPKGHVTFLLTDIEGSTALLGRLDDRYARLRADVWRLVRTAVRQAGGREVDARGDDLFAVFERAPRRSRPRWRSSARWAPAAWPEEVDVRLRIGMHRGRPTLTDTGYVGLAVHAAARIGFAATAGRSSSPPPCGRRSTSHSHGGSASGAWAPGDFRVCPTRWISSRWTRPSCSPTFRLLDRPRLPGNAVARRADIAERSAVWPRSERLSPRTELLDMGRDRLSRVRLVR